MTVPQAVALSAVALLPLVAARKSETAYRLVAAGFAVSFCADMIAIAQGGSWGVLHFLPSIQLGLFAYAFGSVLVPALLFSMTLVGPYDAPDMLVTVVGSGFVLFLAQGHPLFGSMVLYCFVGSALYLLLLSEIQTPAFMPLWYPYQAARFGAFFLFARAVHAQHD